MNTIIIISAFLAISLASPLHHVNVAEDTLGNYKFDFDLGDQKKAEDHDQNGQVVGSYVYVDPEGHTHAVTYEAGDQGFIAKSEDIPVEVSDLVENVRAYNQHAKVFNAVRDNPAFRETLEDDAETPTNPEEYLSALKVLLAHEGDDIPEAVQAKLDLIHAHAVAVGL